MHGANVAMGYWQNQQLTERTFGARLVNAPDGTPEEPWLRTGDLGFICDGELFIVGRDKDLLVVYGRNHYPDDIEATIQEITRGRAAAIAVPDGHTEKLVAIVELKKRGDSAEEVADKLGAVKREVTSAISRSHGLQCRGPRAGGPGLAAHHHERQGQARGLCRAVPQPSVRPPGSLISAEQTQNPPTRRRFGVFVSARADSASDGQADLLELLEVAVAGLGHRSAQTPDEVERAEGFVGRPVEHLLQRRAFADGDLQQRPAR